MKTSTLIISISIVFSSVLYTSCLSRNGSPNPSNTSGQNNTSGQANASGQNLSETDRLKRNAKRIAEREVKVTRVAIEKAHLSCANQAVRFRVTDGEHGDEMHLFRDSHRDFRKLANLQVGQEIKFEFSEIDGDPNCSLAGGEDYVKFLRLASVR